MPRRHYKTARCILFREDRYLLADHHGTTSARRKRHSKHRTRNAAGAIKWGLPGGHVEWREKPADAARRELYEELNIHLGDMLSVGDYVYKQRLHAVFAAASDVTEFELDFSELAAVRWFSAQEVKRLADFDQLHAGYEYDAIVALERLR